MDAAAAARARLAADLAAIPDELAAAARAAPPPAEGEWSAREVVGHLVAVEAAAWHARLDSLREPTDAPRWAWTEPGPWDGPGSESLDGALHAFAIRRAGTIERLARLDDAGWRRSGIHETFGRQDVVAVMQTALEHDREHIAGLAKGSASADG